MAFRGSLSRSALAASRFVRVRAAPAAPGLRPPPLAGVHRPSVSFAPSRPPVALRCVASLLPLHSVVASSCLTSHLSVGARACCELFQGRKGKDG